MGAATTTSIKLDEALKDRLKQLAVAHRRTVHWLMREAIAEYVEREEQKAMTAWSEHQAAKAHRASEAKTEEAVAWLANLEAKGVTTKPGKWPR
jgi:predicted transcriptional regulator